jgi:4-amino-4-deoxy-L-arabinose transferase-like glycosyltransferase
MKREIPAFWRWLALIAALTFVPTLFFPYVGEEGVYTISTLEMWHRHTWWNPLLFGFPYQRPPFLNWVIMPFAMAFGPMHVLLASRLVTALATLGTALVLHWAARGIGVGARQAMLTVLVFLSSDALLYHGWLAYADPLLALLTFSAMACVILAARQNRAALLWVAAVCVFAAFLTKALTSYVFVGATWLVVFARHREARATLLKPAAILSYIVALAAPLVWFHINPSAHVAHQGGLMMGDIAQKLMPPSAGAWLKQVVSFPLETFCRFLPISAIAVYAMARRRSSAVSAAHSWESTIGWVALVNFLPYWLAPQSAIRYVMPLYPLIAFYLASRLARCDARIERVAVYSVAGVIAIKCIGLIVFPLYQVKFRGDAAAVAKQLVALSGTDKVYIDDSTSAGLCIAGPMDSMRWPAAPVTHPPSSGVTEGWILTRDANAPNTRLVKTVQLGKERLFFVCVGRTCRSASAAAVGTD